ncbi:MAG: hypothetical protein HQ567_25325 [Candidatus Nealsonbacteria bacterium]|nr:hypothetical protein [Candidatus Nealsonbacteria bacterium]
MLIPQFTIRWLLVLTAVCGVAFSLFGLAVQGKPWAIGVSVGIGVVAIALLVQAGAFAVVWAFSSITAPLRVRQGRVGRSPFAAHPFAVDPGPNDE